MEEGRIKDSSKDKTEGYNNLKHTCAFSADRDKCKDCDIDIVKYLWRTDRL